MAATIQINGVSQRVATVPYGSTVTLTNAAAIGTSQKWEILDYPLDLDDAGPDFATNFSSWTVAGDGSYFINQTPAYSAVTFKPDVTGTYLIRLTSAETGGSVTQTAVVRITDAHSGEVVPAAGESTESGTREGWKKVVNGRLKRLAKRMQGHVRVVNLTGSTIARGKVVRLIGATDAHTVSPNTNPGGTAAKAEKVFTVTLADNTQPDALIYEYAILDQSLANNQFGWAQRFGLFEGLSDVDYSTATVSRPVYFDSTGTQVFVPPTSGRVIQIGLVLEASSTGSVSVRRSDTPISQVADWSLVSPRFYALDFTSGSDANTGFSDASMAAAGSVAKKTWAGLSAVVSRAGADRDAVIAIKPRDSSGTSYGEDLTISGFTGYRDLHVVGTSDFSDSTTDRILSGFVTATAGPGPGGTWTCAGGGTVNTFTISSGTFPASPTMALWRVRWIGNVTGALTNVCRPIQVHTTGQIVLLQDLPTPPASGDTFLVERPGVVFDNIRVSNSNSRLTLSLRGLGAATDITVSNTVAEGQVVLAGLEARAGQATIETMFRPNITSVYTLIGGGTVDVGIGLKTQTGTTFDEIHNLQITNFGCVAGTTIFRQIRESSQSGLLSRGGTQLIACGISGVPTGGNGFVFGRSSAGFRDHLIDGGSLSIQQTNGYLQNTIIQNAGATPAIRVVGDSLNLGFNNVTGSTGNTQQGVSPNCTNSKLTFTSTTLTGTSGNIVLQATYAISYSDLLITNVFDTSGNEILGAAGHVVGEAVIVANLTGGVVGVGEIIRSNGVSNQVTSAKADTSANVAGPLLVALHTTTPADKIIATPLGRGAWLAFDGPPTVGALAYLSPGTTRKATTTIPAATATNQRRRLGFVLTASGNYGQVIGTPELLAVDANGTA